MAVPIAAVIWAFGAPGSSWRIALLAAFGVYLIGVVQRHFLKRFSKRILRNVFGDFQKETLPEFEIGDVVMFDHTSSGLTAEGAQVVAVFSSGRLAREMGLEKTAFEVGWTKPGVYYGVAVAEIGEPTDPEREEFVVLPEDMLRLVQKNREGLRVRPFLTQTTNHKPLTTSRAGEARVGFRHGPRHSEAAGRIAHDVLRQEDLPVVSRGRERRDDPR